MEKTSGWDLHCHTVFSDGTRTPLQLMQEARERGLDGAAITDHDTAAGWTEAANAARELGMSLIRGTEMSAHWPLGGGKISVHVLAWLYDPDGRRLAELFARTRQRRLERARTMVANLARDYPISWESVCDQAKESDATTVGRPHMADALVAAGVYRTRADAFDGVLSKRGPYYVPVETPTATEAIRAIKDAGGVAALAHVGSFARNRVILSDDQIRACVDCGLDALEVRHRENSPEQRTRLTRLARRWGLLVTGGSDWHGRGGKPNMLGENSTDAATVKEIARRGAIPVV